MSRTSAVWALASACAIVYACSRSDSSRHGAADSTATLMPAPAETTSSATAASTAQGDSIIRGTVKRVSDSALTLTTAAGDVSIATKQPLKIYARRDATLARVTDHSFIGVTSVRQPDGTERATEIHIFQEELRGLGEGSRPMGQPRGGAGSTMTNGSVAGSRMTNGSATMTNGSATMTNGATRGAASGGTLTVEYRGGTQTISVPAGVAVTEIAPTTTKLAPGASVVVPARRQANGGLEASLVMLAGEAGRPR